MTNDKKASFKGDNEGGFFTAVLHHIEHISDQPGHIGVMFQLNDAESIDDEYAGEMFGSFEETVDFLALCMEGDSARLRVIYSAKTVADLKAALGASVDLEVGTCDCCEASIIIDVGPPGSLVEGNELEDSYLNPSINGFFRI